MKRIRVRVTRSSQTGTLLSSVCPTCAWLRRRGVEPPPSGDVSVSNGNWATVEGIARCSSGHEVWIEIRGEEALARAPYGVDAWFNVQSSNLSGVGAIRDDLVVRFAKGTAYRYFGAAAELEGIRDAESAGKALNTLVKPKYRAEPYPTDYRIPDNVIE